MNIGKTVPGSAEGLGKNDLIKYLKEFVLNIELDEEPPTPAMLDFILLHKKIIAELSRQRVYKVSTVDTSDVMRSGIKEYHTQYFGSLQGAKRELKRRFHEQRKHPFVAAPDEVQDIGLTEGINPSLVQSVVTNNDTRLTAPGRYKFYEVRMLRDNEIIPVQFMLTSIDVTPAACTDIDEKDGKKIAINSSQSGRGLVIPFNSLRK